MSLDRIELRGCTVDVRRQRLMRGEEETAIGGRELGLLVYLAERPGQTVPRDELYREVWGYSDAVVSRAIDAAVRRLRVKVEVDPGDPDHLFSEHGEGYRFEPLEAPVARRGLLGRDADLDRVLAALRANGWVQVVGPGGVGKTRLAREVMQTWGRPARFVDLVEARSGADVRGAVARALDVTTSTLDAALDARAGHLVVLDNLEQLGDDAAEVVERWAELPVALLGTSRRALGTGPVVRLQPLERGAAVALLRERAMHAVDDDVAGELVDALDRLPLAIELAAARTAILGPADLLMRLAERFRLLKRPEGGLGRHDTLRGTIDWSWELLGPAEQATLAQCSVFRGGFSASAAEQVVELADGDVLDALHLLQQHGLVWSESRPGGVRLHLYESVRSYAAERLAQSGDEAAARHARFFARLGEDLDRLRRHGCREERSVLGVELDNLAAAVHGGEEADTRLRAALAVAAVVRRTEPERGVRAVDAALGEESRAPARAALLLARGQLLLAAGRLREAERALREARAEPAVAARAGAWLGRALYALRRPHAPDVLAAALEACRAAGDRIGEGIALDGLGLVAPFGSDEARECLATALEVHSEVGHAHFEAVTSTNLGRQFVHEDPARERAHYDRAIALHRRAGNRLGEALGWTNVGVSLREEGRWDEGREGFEQAFSLYRESGSVGRAVRCLALTGDLEMCRGDWDAAAQLFTEALELERTAGAGIEEGQLLTYLGAIELERGRLEEARARLRAALGVHWRDERQDRVARTESLLARAEGRPALLDAAVERLEGSLGPYRLEAGIYAEQAAALASRGEIEAARDVLVEAWRALEAGPQASARMRWRRGQVLIGEIAVRQAGGEPSEDVEAELAGLVEGLFPGHAEMLERMRVRVLGQG